MKLEILQIGATELTAKNETVTDFDDQQLHKLIEDMIETCKADIDSTAGLAAPQVGENIQLTIVRRTDLEDRTQRGSKASQEVIWEPLINPEILDKSEEQSRVWEACLSIGKGSKQIWGPVWRPKWVKVKYQDREGESRVIEGDGFFSHLLQHEIDHLNGKLFLSLVQNPEENLWKAEEIDEYLEKHGQYPPER